MEVAQSCTTVCDPMDCIVPGILQARILEWVAFPFSRVSSQPRIEPRSPSLQADSLPAEPQRKPKHTGVGSLSLLQQIFLTQKSNQGLLHCRWILYQLSYKGSPMMEKSMKKNMYMHIYIYITKSLCSTPETNRRRRGQKADLYSPHHVRIYKEMPVNQAEGTQQSLIMTLDC